MAVGLPVVIAAIAVFFIGKSETEEETIQTLAPTEKDLKTQRVLS